jgi:hypothetical protein
MTIHNEKTCQRAIISNIGIDALEHVWRQLTWPARIELPSISRANSFARVLDENERVMGFRPLRRI